MCPISAKLLSLDKNGYSAYASAMTYSRTREEDPSSEIKVFKNSKKIVNLNLTLMTKDMQKLREIFQVTDDSYIVRQVISKYLEDYGRA